MEIAFVSCMVSLSNWPRSDLPRTRLRELGARALSDSEVLALVIGTGSRSKNVIEVASQIIEEAGSLERLSEQGIGTLGGFVGVGEAKATRIVAAVELGIRVQERLSRPKNSCRFECSSDIFEAYRSRFGALKQEVFIVVGLNNRNEMIRELVVAKGSVNECRVEPREVFRPLIAEAAVRSILIHNHPSGDPTPSPNDVALTRRLAAAGRLLGIPILDHVIISRASHASLRDLGLLVDEPLTDRFTTDRISR
jgi:DNA repair protein RadC